MAKLTDITAFSGTLNGADLVHVVDVSDTSQDPAGSSYKLTITQLNSAITPGTGTTNYHTKWTGLNTLGDSPLYDNGTNLGLNTTTPSAKFHIINNTEQLRIGYDTTNYVKTTVSSAGLVTSQAVGSVNGFLFNVTGTDLGLRVADLTSGNSIMMQGQSTYGVPAFTANSTIAIISTAGEFMLKGGSTALLYTNGQTFNLSAVSGGAAQLTLATNGNVSVGGSAPSASALLDIGSTTKGFLPPRMTTAQKNAIGTPVAGLIVYDSTLNKLCVYTTAWETITSV